MVNSIIRVCEVCGTDISHKKSKKARVCSTICNRAKSKLRTCTIEGCGRPSQGGILCSSHRIRAKAGILDKPIHTQAGLSRKHKKLSVMWAGMRQRCTNPNHKAYKYYGARGIQICERWSSFENFLADMGEPPGPSYSIDRIDNNMGYTPTNCRWATIVEQNRNSRNFKLSDVVQETIMFLYWHNVEYADIADCVGVCVTTLSKFLRYRGFFRYPENRRS